MDNENLTLLFQIGGYLLTAIGVWTNLNNKITQLEGQVAANVKNIERIERDRKELTDELKEIKSIMMEVKVEVGKLGVSNRNRTNEN